MNHCVPDFDMDDNYSIPTSAGLSRSRKSSMPDDEIMELLWQNGQVVTQNQNQRSFKKSLQSKYDGDQSREIRPQTQGLEEPSSSHQHHNLFMQEDEMASWLHYPLHDSTFDQDFCADLLYAAPSVTTTTTATPPNRTTQVSEPPTTEITTSRPPIPPARRSEVQPKVVQNFALFSRQKARFEQESVAGPSSSKSVVRESAVVDSSDTPGLGQETRVSQAARIAEGASGGNIGFGTLDGATVARSLSAGGGKETMACEMTVTSSPDGSSASAGPSLKQPAPPEDRKRKGREADDVDCQSEDAEFESGNAKKQVRGSTSTKRSRAAEVHNLSERRRRDRINEKMRALQELIPRCNKSDKASMLDEAIEYLKSLQMQVQMMSMGCSMVPMMFPGVQQYLPPMGIGIGMGMQMGMEMSMSRPMMPFPNVLGGSGSPTPATAGHSGPRFLVPSFHTPSVPSRIQSTSQSDPMITSHGIQIPNQPRVPNFADPYQQYLGLHQMQLAQVQNQVMPQPSTSKPNNEKGAENHENHQSGAG